MSDYTQNLLRRVVELRRFPLLAAGDLDELATLAQNVVETRYRAGQLVAPADRRVSGLQLILDGRIETDSEAWAPHQVFGALEIFAGRTARAAAIATVDTRALVLPARDIGELLEDNFGLLLSTLRVLAARVTRLSLPSPQLPRLELAGAALGLVERLILLRRQLPFTNASLHALATLAHGSEELRLPPGAVVARAGEPAEAGLVIVDGAVAHGSFALGAGDALGHLEALAGVAHVATIETTSPVRALRSSGPALIDMLEDHTDVGLAMIATLAGALLDATSPMN